MLRSLLTLFISQFVGVALLCAQSPENKPSASTTPPLRTKAAVVIEPSRAKTEISAPALDPDYGKTNDLRRSRTTEEEVIVENPRAIKDRSSKKWERAAFGFYVGATNNAITKALIKRTEDDVIKNTGQELGIGLGANMDFALPGAQQTSMRFQAGLYRLNVKAHPDVRAAFSPTDLESSENVFHGAFLYRQAFSEFFEIETIWLGAGAEVNYIWSTSRPGSSSSPPRSQLKGSYGLSPLLALGIDCPVSTFEDLTLSFQYVPWKGWALHAGFRTSL